MAQRKKRGKPAPKKHKRKLPPTRESKKPSPPKRPALGATKPRLKARGQKTASASRPPNKPRGRPSAPVPTSRERTPAARREVSRIPQRWYRETGRREAESMFPDEGNDEQRVQAADFRLNVIAKKRALELDYLRTSVKRLRKIVEGFAAEDGYDLRHPEFWTKQQADRVRAFSHEVGSIMSQPHKLVRPRSKRSTVSLEVFTGQRFKKQKAWIVHVPAAEESTVKITSSGKVEVVRKVRGGEVVDRFYLFEEIFGRRPETWDEIVEMTRILVGEKKYRQSYLYDPDYAESVRVMPKGLYTLWVETQGDTDAPVKRELLIRRLREFQDTYGNAMSSTWKGGGFEDVILGFHWQGTNRDAAMAKRQRLVAERNAAARERRLQRQARRRFITRRATK